MRLFFSKGRTYEYDEGNPAAMLWERGVVPEYEGKQMFLGE